MPGHVRCALVLVAGVLGAGLVVGLASSARAPRSREIARLAGHTVRPPLLRVELRLVPDARTRPHILLLTLGGPVYCGQLFELASYLNASLLCPDYGRNGEKSGLSRAARLEDWGAPDYLDAVARLPASLQREGVKISKLVLIGASYAGYANAELVATHPALRPSAMIIVDSYLDLPARYRALSVPSGLETRKEIDKALGGTLAERPQEYAARSPSNHLEGIAEAMRRGMRLVAVWSIWRGEKLEFNGATCSRAANAEWLAKLATLLGHPLVAYVTWMRHSDALRYRWRDLLALAGLASGPATLRAQRVTFEPGKPVPAGSYCG